MSKEAIIKMVEIIDEQLENNLEVTNVYIPTTQLLKDIRKMWTDILLRDYGVFYD